MSHAGIITEDTATGADLKTLTGDAGGAVAGDGSNNVDIFGTAAQGVSTAGTPGSNLVTVTVADATTTTKGVSSFAAADFTVAAGIVSLAGAGSPPVVNGLIPQRYQMPSFIWDRCSQAAVVMAADRIDVCHFHVPITQTFDRVAIDVTTGDAGKVAKLGLYNMTSSGLPGTLVYDFGELSVAAIAGVEIVIDQEIAAGNYYLAIITDGTASIRAFNDPPLSTLSTGNLVDTSTDGVPFYTGKAYASGFVDLTAVAPNGYDNDVFKIVLRPS